MKRNCKLETTCRILEYDAFLCKRKQHITSLKLHICFLQRWVFVDLQATRKIENQRFVKLKKNSDAESTIQLEEQIYTYQCSVEVALRSLANFCKLVKQPPPTPGQ